MHVNLKAKHLGKEGVCDNKEVTATCLHNTKVGLDILNHDFLLAVAAGQVEKHIIINKYGANAAVGTSFVPVCDGGTYQTPMTAESLEVVSDSAADGIAGTGARTVKIYGIGADWLDQTETIIINGTTAVPSTKTWLRVYRARVTGSGTYGSSAGASHSSTITVQGTGGGDVWALIVEEGGFGLSSTEIGVYSVPKNMTAYLLSIHLDVEGSKVVDTLTFKRENADVITVPYAPMVAINVKRNIDGEHAVDGHGAPLATLVGPCDIGIMAKISSGTAKVEVEFVLLCVED